MRVGRVKACTADEDLVRLGALAIGSADDELMERLARVQADVDGERGGIGAFLIGGHGIAPDER